MEELCSRMEKGKEEQKFEGVDSVVGYLRCSNIKAKDCRNSETKYGCAAQQGVNPYQNSSGNAPGEPLRRSAYAKKSENGKDRLPIEPPVVSYRRAWGDFPEAGLVLRHGIQDRLPSRRMLVGGDIA